jgi:urease accessory protein
VTQADLLVINKVELSDAVGASLEVMARDAKKQRESGPLVMANVKRSVGVPEIAEHVIAAWTTATGGKKEKARDGADEGEGAREAKKAKA